MTAVQVAPKSFGSLLIESRPAQWTIGFIKECHNFRDNTDFFEKIFQVANAALHLLPNPTYYSRLSLSLSTVVMHDFYNFLKQPNKWMFTYNADTIVENGTLDSLQAALQKKLGSSHVAAAREYLEWLLGDMRKLSVGFKTEDEFKKELLERMINLKKVPDPLNPTKRPVPLKLSIDDLKDFHVTPRQVPFIEKLTNFTWILVDIGTIGYFFQKWNLFDTAKWGERIGLIPGFQWVPTNSFDTWVVGGICSGFGLKLAEASRKLFDEALTNQERKQARWDVATATAESIYWGSMFLNRIGQTAFKDSTIYLLAIGAKTLGLISIIYNSGKHQYFQEKTAPAAWFFQAKAAPAA